MAFKFMYCVEQNYLKLVQLYNKNREFYYQWNYSFQSTMFTTNFNDNAYTRAGGLVLFTK